MNFSRAHAAIPPNIADLRRKSTRESRQYNFEFADRLEALGLNNLEFAKIAGCSAKHISAMRTGLRPLRPVYMALVASLEREQLLEDQHRTFPWFGTRGVTSA